MVSLLTSYQGILHAKHSLYWGGRGLAPHPFLAINPSPKSNIVILSFIDPLCIECIYVVSYGTCKLFM
jgi:hypothetical protein